MAGAAALDEQLALLYAISCDYAAELEAGGWELGLTCALAEPLPEDLLPPSGDMAEEEQIGRAHV